MIYLKIGSLVLSIWITSSNIMNGIRGHGIPWSNFLLMAIGWTAFIFSMGWLV
ncbi:hypothetical protein LCGC14_1789160 [marine sediment metagenome]|uniref:Uncharacterized protein n=1 Tax=marine sediment metagenome TaxID=412755 RepID=A0A0F9JSN2_9ZZZZ